MTYWQSESKSLRFRKVWELAQLVYYDLLPSSYECAKGIFDRCHKQKNALSCRALTHGINLSWSPQLFQDLLRCALSNKVDEVELEVWREEERIKAVFWTFCTFRCAIGKQIWCLLYPAQGVLTWESASCHNLLTKCALECVILNFLTKKSNVIFGQKIA